MRWIAALTGLACALALAAWLAGFAWFLHLAGARPAIPPPADAIVVLTGGADRVETGLRMLADGFGQILLVSGVGGSAEFGALARRAGVDAALGRRVTLGRSAASTRGNAAETAEWARARGVRSLIVVTAGYHMPRAVIELSRALPGIALYPVPAIGRTAPSVRLLTAEYTKWLGAALGLSRYGSHGEPLPADVPGRPRDQNAEVLARASG